MVKGSMDSAEEKKKKKASAENVSEKKHGEAQKKADNQVDLDMNLPDEMETPEEMEPSQEDTLLSELADMKERYIRLLAEYENFRKRSQKEKESLYADAIADVSRQWLPVVDNIERALCFSKNISEDSAEKIAEGVELIFRQVLEVFEKIGIVEIACEEGGCFDPEVHEAVMHVEDDTFGEQCVAQVFQKGYRAGERVIRHSVVKVAN